MPRRFTFARFRTELMLAVACLLAIALLWSLTVERIRYERNQATWDEVTNNQNLALAFDEHTALSLKNLDHSLQLLLHEFSEADGVGIRKLIDDGFIDHGDYSFIGVVDAHGDLTQGSSDFAPANFAEREWFVAHRQQSTQGLFIGKPSLERATGRWSMQLSRRLSKPDGSFGGVIYVSVDPVYFTKFYEKTDLGRAGMAQLVGLDGITRTRRTGSVTSFGQDASKSTLFSEVAKSKTGSYISLGILEGVRRFASYRVLDNYPLVVVVGTSEDEVLQEFHARARNYYLAAALASVLLLILVAALIVISARKKRTELMLAGSEQRFRALIENVSDLIVLVDVRGLILFVSPSLKRMMGYDAGEVLGKSFVRFIHPDDAAGALEDFSKVIRDAGAVVTSERRFRRKNGTWVTLDSIVRNTLDDPLLAGIIINARDVTERRQSQQELEFKNSMLLTQQESSLDGILVVDPGMKIIARNQRFSELFRIPADALNSGNDRHVLESVLDQFEDPEVILAKVKYLYKHKDEKSSDELRMKDGRIIDRYSAPVISASDAYYGRVWYFRDITEQKTATDRIRKLNMLYMTLSGGNAAIVHSSSRRELCQRICDVASKQGGWTGAWIGFVDSATLRIVPEAWSDSMAPYIKQMVVSIDPAVPQGHGPTGLAVRSGTPYFCNDVFADQATIPWRQFAANFGIGSSAAVPLRLGNDIVGVINFYSVQKEFYTPDVQALLLELRDDVSFALGNFDREAQRLQTARMLAENEEKFRGLIEQTIAGIYIIQDDKFAYVNPRFAEIAGYEIHELIGKTVLDIVDEPSRALVAENIRKRIGGFEKTAQYTLVIKRKDGTPVDIGVHGSRAVFQGRPAVIGIMQDITERKKNEAQLKHYLEQLEASMVGTIDAVSAMVELRDPYTAGHERRVAEIAAAIGTELGLTEVQIKGLKIIGTVHDIGKIAVPAEILSKPGRLSALEFEIIKTHAQQGHDILKAIDFPWPVAQTILQHHERFDGSGYPQGLKGDQIIIEARILAVADAVEAMSSHRPYRAGLGIAAALLEIEEQSGKRYDPQTAAACLRLFREKHFQIPD